MLQHKHIMCNTATQYHTFDYRTTPHTITIHTIHDTALHLYQLKHHIIHTVPPHMNVPQHHNTPHNAIQHINYNINTTQHRSM